MQAVQEKRQRSEAAPGDPDRLADQLGALLRMLFLDPRADHLRAIEEQGLSLTQVRSLVLLAAAEEPIGGGELADRIGLSAAAMSRSLDGLAERKLIVRRECTDDRRVRLIEVSARGRKLVEELVTLRRAGLRRFVEGLGEEQRVELARALTGLGCGEDRR